MKRDARFARPAAASAAIEYDTAIGLLETALAGADRRIARRSVCAAIAEEIARSRKWSIMDVSTGTVRNGTARRD